MNSQFFKLSKKKTGFLVISSYLPCKTSFMKLQKSPRNLNLIISICQLNIAIKYKNCTLLQLLPLQGFILKILSRGEGIVTQRG